MQPQPVAQEDPTAAIAPAVCPVMPWRVASVEAWPSFRLPVRFLDGLEGVVDMSALIASPNAGVFRALLALTEVGLMLDSGEVLGLVCASGASKATLGKVLAGNFPPAHGEIRFGGEAVHFHKPVEARQKGVEVVYQDLALCNNLSAAANVFLGREIKRGAGPLRWLHPKGVARRGGHIVSRL